MKTKTIVIAASSVALLLGATFIFFQKRQTPSSSYSNNLPKILETHRKNMQDSPWAQAYRNGKIEGLLKVLQESHPKEREEFYRFSIRYFDLKEPNQITNEQLKQLTENLLRNIDSQYTSKQNPTPRSLGLTFLKRLRGRGNDELIRSHLLANLQQIKSKDLLFLDSVDVLVAIDPFDSNLMEKILTIIKTAPPQETYPLVQILSELKDSTAMLSFLKLLANQFHKVGPDLQPVYFKVLVERGSALNLDLNDQYQWIMKQSSEASMDALLSVLPYTKRPSVFKAIVQKLSQQSNLRHLQVRAKTLLEDSTLWQAK